MGCDNKTNVEYLESQTRADEYKSVEAIESG